MPTCAVVALLLALAIILPGVLPDAGLAAPSAPVALGDSIGAEVDPLERDAYGLFPDVTGFRAARFVPRDGGYRLEYVARAGDGPDRTRARRISKEAFELTQWHVALTDAFRAGGQDPGGGTLGEAGWLRRLALRYASERRYDAGTVLVQDLRRRYPGTEEGAWADRAAPRFEALARRRAALIWPGSLLDQGGRTDLLVFSGYYGLWLGVAVPVALGADDKGSYAAGIMLVPAASVLAASAATRNAPITRGTASLISLGGHLGTWQGLGWAGMGDADGEAVVGTGVLAGLAGIAAAVPIARAVDVTEGHGEIMSSAMYWGGWFGAVAGVLANHDDTQENGVLSDMLIGSDAAVLAGAIAGKGARLSKGRMRLINLCGVLGGVFGMGLAITVDDPHGETVMALIGGGSAAGLLLGVHATRSHDRGMDLSARHAEGGKQVASSGHPGPALRIDAMGQARTGSGPAHPPPRVAVSLVF